MSRRLARPVLASLGLWLCASGLSACHKDIGDKCRTALDCSISATRVCDRTQPGGYCTVQDCEAGGCPPHSVCVRFRPAVDRLAVTYCMYGCDDSSDCRDDQGYRCLHAADFGEKGEAEILGFQGNKFCAVRDMPPAGFTPADDAGEQTLQSIDDAGSTDGGDAQVMTGGG